MANSETTAKGVVGIYTDAVGNVIRSVSDFDQSGYGGFSKQEAQKFRVKRQLAFAVVRAYCSDPILKTLDDYQCEEILNKLVKNGGKATYIPVGYEDE